VLCAFRLIPGQSASAGFNIVDNVTFNGESTTPVDTRYGGKSKFALANSFSLFGRSAAYTPMLPTADKQHGLIRLNQAASAPPASTAAPPPSPTAAATALAALPS